MTPSALDCMTHAYKCMYLYLLAFPKATEQDIVHKKQVSNLVVRSLCSVHTAHQVQKHEADPGPISFMAWDTL